MIRSFCWLFSSFSDLLLLQAHVDFSLEQLCAAYVSDIDKKRSVCFHYYMYAWKPLKSGVQSLSGILSGRAFISHMSFMHETHGSALKIVNFLISVLALFILGPKELIWYCQVYFVSKLANMQTSIDVLFM